MRNYIIKVHECTSSNLIGTNELSAEELMHVFPRSFVAQHFEVYHHSDRCISQDHGIVALCCKVLNAIYVCNAVRDARHILDTIEGLSEGEILTKLLDPPMPGLMPRSYYAQPTNDQNLDRPIYTPPNNDDNYDLLAKASHHYDRDLDFTSQMHYAVLVPSLYDADPEYHQTAANAIRNYKDKLQGIPGTLLINRRGYICEVNEDKIVPNLSKKLAIYKLV